MPRSTRAPLAAITFSVLALFALPATAFAFGPLSSIGSLGVEPQHVPNASHRRPVAER